MGTVVAIYAVGEPRKEDISFVMELTKKTKDVVVVFFYDDYAGFGFFERYKKAFNMKNVENIHKIKIPGPIFEINDPILQKADKIIDLTRENVDSRQFPHSVPRITPPAS